MPQAVPFVPVSAATEAAAAGGAPAEAESKPMVRSLPDPCRCLLPTENGLAVVHDCS